MSLYRVARAFLRVLLWFKGYRIEGKEKFPVQGPVIIAANHLSLWDPVVVGCALDRTVYYMAKGELFDIPFLGWLLRNLKAFPVKRGQGDIAAIRKAIAVLKEGNVLGVFPEGTRSKSGEIQEAMAGIALIMEKSKAPVVPIKVFGTGIQDSKKRGSFKVIIGNPIYPDKIVIPNDVENKRNWLANHIMTCVDDM